ncbi:MAG: GAF domain-containing protein, partial [bacterium]|nr:GAF domain-containing protein [bacterium]
KKKKILGVLAVQNYERENTYDQEHLQILITIASQTAIAISKAKIFKEAKNRMHELEALFETLKEISGKALDTKGVLEAIVKRAVELSKAYGGIIFLCDNARKELKVVVTHNLAQLKGIKMKFGEGLAGLVAESGKPKIKNDYYKWKGKFPLFKSEEYKNLFRAIVEVPLESKGEVIGVLGICTTDKKHIFNKDDVRLLERFAGPAAIVINNARTYSYLHALVESTPDAIVSVDRNGIVTEFNEASEKVSGFRMDEVKGRHVRYLYWGRLDEAKKIESLLKASKDGKIRNVETYVKSKSGERIPIHLSAALLYDENGERIGSVGHVEDLREIRLLDERYRALYEVGKVTVEHPESDMEDICREFIDILTKKMMHYKAGYICLMNENDELELMSVGEDGENEKHGLKSILRIGQRIVSQLLETKKPIYIKNVQKDKRFKHLKWAKQNNIYSSLVIPLIVEMNVIGEITIFKGEEYEFSEGEKEFLYRFASLAALVIDKERNVNRREENAKVLEEVTHDIIELSGENIFGDMMEKMEMIIKRRVPDTNFCIYKCDADNGKLAVTLDIRPDKFRERLKYEFYRGETPFKNGLTDKRDYRRVIPIRATGKPERIEGVLVVEKIQLKNGVIRQFNEVELLVLSMIATAVGMVFFQWRIDGLRGFNGSQWDIANESK